MATLELPDSGDLSNLLRYFQPALAPQVGRGQLAGAPASAPQSIASVKREDSPAPTRKKRKG